MTGWYRMQRGWQGHPIFADEPYTEREAWEWLIANAAWKPTTRRAGKGDLVAIARGQLHVSDRSLADTWQWDKKKVRRFLDRLAMDHMLAQSKDHSGTILTIENYQVYQVGSPEAGPIETPSNGPTEDQSRTTQEEGKEYTHGAHARTREERYAFEGETIRLTPPDFEKWRAAYSTIPDLRAELTSLDAWWADQPPEKRKQWFVPTMKMLNAKHQRLAATALAPAAGNGHDTQAWRREKWKRENPQFVDHYAELDRLSQQASH